MRRLQWEGRRAQRHRQGAAQISRHVRRAQRRGREVQRIVMSVERSRQRLCVAGQWLLGNLLVQEGCAQWVRGRGRRRAGTAGGEVEGTKMNTLVEKLAELERLTEHLASELIAEKLNSDGRTTLKLMRRQLLGLKDQMAV